MFSKERFPVSRTVPLFPNINRDFIPLGTTHYNIISGSVNRKTQDIVLFNKNQPIGERILQLSQYRFPLAVWCIRFLLLRKACWIIGNKLFQAFVYILV
jgi:hypothetical protein